MIIDWYPGHMKKARAQIIEILPKIDLVLEVVDARLPSSSSNPLLERLRGDKPCIKILNKKDLADANITRSWLRHFEQHHRLKALSLEARDRRDVGLVPKLCRNMLPERVRSRKPLRIMVAGIPNVGKSTLINTLAGKKIARVGDKPAITTTTQQIDLRNGLLLLDTPGLLWPVLDNLGGACRLAASGALGEAAYATLEVALTTINYLLTEYPHQLISRYQLAEPKPDPILILEQIGRSRGCLVSGGNIDLQRAADILLRDLRGNKIGRISLERPDEKDSPFDQYQEPE
ncbi:MAG: ribosome biogenesis GTPase YlqF [Pelovirga sp.]